MRYNNSVNNLFLNQKVVQVTTDYTVLPDDVIIEVGALSASITLTLPTSSTQNKGKFYLIKDGSGTAQTHSIEITDPASTIDGSSNYTIAQNYGSVQLFSTGESYSTYSKNFSIKQATSLIKGGWIGNADFGNNSPQTKIGSAVKNWTTTLIPVEDQSDPRLDLNGLGFLYLDREQLKLASDSRSIAFRSPGLYRILLNASLIGALNDLPRTPLVQLIKNKTIIMKACPIYERRGADLNAALIFYQGSFAADDSIDIRFATYGKGNLYHIYCLGFFIYQLPIYRYH